MDHYIDIRLRPDPEFPQALLMKALYSKFHKALHDLKANDIGISFPEHKQGVRARTLGELARIHGGQDQLAQLMAQTWLNGMRDHIHEVEILPVPSEARHWNVRRRQFNTGSESVAKRYAKRHEISLEEARQIYAKLGDRRIALPFAQLNSRSTAQVFSLFIEHGRPTTDSTSGSFNHYGLSATATVPHF